MHKIEQFYWCSELKSWSLETTQLSIFFCCKCKHPLKNKLNLCFSSSSSYALENTNEVIQVLYKKEELSIESLGMDPVTMKVDPFEVSVQDVKKFIEVKLNIEADRQHLRFNGQNIYEMDKLSDMFITAKKIPVIRVDTDRDIVIKVCQSSGNEQEVPVNWFATVDYLKELLVEKGICETSDTLKFNYSELTGKGEKQLIDLDFKPVNSVITVRSQPRSAHRGFSASDFEK